MAEMREWSPSLLGPSRGLSRTGECDFSAKFNFCNREMSVNIFPKAIYGHFRQGLGEFFTSIGADL